MFVSGHPGGTSRLLTMAELEHLRDHSLPFRLHILNRQEVLLAAWSARTAENARRAQRPSVRRAKQPQSLRWPPGRLARPGIDGAQSQSRGGFQERLSDAATRMGRRRRPPSVKFRDASQNLRRPSLRYSLLESGQAFNCDSFRIARILLRAGDERPKPNGERLREYSDSGKVSLELSLFSEKPIYTDVEILTLADSLTFLAGELGDDDPLVQQILAGKSPRDRAVELINTTKVRDVPFRKKLYEGGAAAVTAAADPMIELARLVDAPARALRKVADEQGEVVEQAHAAIARARNAVSGSNSYPDATFTLRLAFGTMKDYEEAGKSIPAITTIAGLYQRAAEMNSRPPFDLPQSGFRANPR